MDLVVGNDVLDYDCRPSSCYVVDHRDFNFVLDASGVDLRVNFRDNFTVDRAVISDHVKVVVDANVVCKDKHVIVIISDSFRDEPYLLSFIYIWVDGSEAV